MEYCYRLASQEFFCPVFRCKIQYYIYRYVTWQGYENYRVKVRYNNAEYFISDNFSTLNDAEKKLKKLIKKRIKQYKKTIKNLESLIKLED